MMLVDQVTRPAVHGLAGERARQALARRRGGGDRRIACRELVVRPRGMHGKELREAGFEKEPLAQLDRRRVVVRSSGFVAASALVL